MAEAKKTYAGGIPQGGSMHVKAINQAKPKTAGTVKTGSDLRTGK